MLDVNARFARAEAAFRAGDHDAARTDIRAVLGGVGDHPAVLHLLALVEGKAGRDKAARDAFTRALAKAPADPQINNNYANLLDALGEPEAALAHYDRAIVASPAFAAARLNRATTLQKLGRLEDALADLDRLAAGAADASVLATRGTVLRLLGRLDAATADFDAAMALDPALPVAAHGAARTAMEVGDEARAITLYRRAEALSPDDLEVRLGLAEAHEAAGDAAGIALLARTVGENLQWIAGQDALARMRSEARDGGDFARGYAEALALHPGDRALHFAHWRALARGDRHADALAALDAAKPALATDDALRLTEAVLASEAGDVDRAEALFAALPDDDQARLGRGRLALRRHDPARAATLLEPVARRDLSLVTAWAHLAIAWRMLGDPRHQWLCEQPGLCATRDLSIDAAALDALASVLRGLHRNHAHPIGQSLRGGTQTRGRLLARPEPEIAGLRDLLRGAIDDHVAALPPHDPDHPLLRHRDDRFAFDGSWSVRLSGSGFHINHIHPEGALSSACYIALPAETGAGAKAGWLEIGAPPVELGLGLPPLDIVEPKPGRLALFPSYLFHGTRPFADGERLTVAFDVVV